MEELKNFYLVVDGICEKDPRYKSDSYEFVMRAISHTQKVLKKDGHVTGRELLDGVKDFAVSEYGPMARTVLKHWGINKTQDFGNIVFNMIDKKLLSKTETDSVDDFTDVYDFDDVFKPKMPDVVI